MNILLILNEAPYGNERSYNGLRLARELLKDTDAGRLVRVFLLGDAAACARAGQKVPQGYYNVADMLGGVLRRGGEVAVCGTCMDARGLADGDLVAGAKRGSMELLAGWTVETDKALVF
ncbi:MAG: DsrE/DsrF/TusD sulfur relay family protein [Betaproteobacteria bacterium]